VSDFLVNVFPQPSRAAVARTLCCADPSGDDRGSSEVPLTTVEICENRNRVPRPLSATPDRTHREARAQSSPEEPLCSERREEKRHVTRAPTGTASRSIVGCSREQTRSPLDLDLPLHLISSGRYRLDVHALFLDIEIALTEGPRRRRGVLIDERSVPWATLRFGRRGCGARTSYGVRITTLISGTQWQSVAHLLRGPAKLISGNPWHSMAISGAPPKGS